MKKINSIKYDFPNAYDSFVEIINKLEIPIEEFDFFAVLDNKYLIADHVISGPREPNFVWIGHKWISSEDNLSGDEEEIMDEVAAECPGGLGGWS